MRILAYSFLAAFLAVSGSGQSVVEHSVITAGASAAAAGTSSGGKSIGGVFGSLSKTLDKAGNAGKSDIKPATATATTASAQPEEFATPARARRLVDPSEIADGLARADLIKRFGDPLLSLIDGTRSELVERMWYPTAFDQVEITLIGGKVASVQPRPAKQQAKD